MIGLVRYGVQYDATSLANSLQQRSQIKVTLHHSIQYGVQSILHGIQDESG
jgi:hypothetical protein